MFLVKNYLFKILLIGFLSVILGCMSIYLSPLVSKSDYGVYPLVFFSSIGILLTMVLFLLKWERLLFVFALSIGFQLYDPSPFEILFFILILLSFMKQIPFNRHMFQNVLFLLLFLFLLFGTFSIFFSTNFYKAMNWHLITLYLVLSSVFLVLVIKNENQLLFFLRGYVLGAVINSILGLMIYFTGKTHGNRLNGFFQDPNIFSPYVILAIMLVIEDSLCSKLFKSKQFKFFSIILMIGAVVLAMSRAGWINLAIAIFIYGAIKVVKKQLKPGFVIKTFIIPFIMLLGVYFIFPSVIENQLKERTTLQYYDNERFGAQFFTLQVAENNPLGIGPGEITSIYFMDTHNTYYRTLAEYGWISGASLILLLLILGGILLKRCLFLQRSEFNIYLVFISSLAGTLVNISVVDALHWRHFWVFVGLCLYVIFSKKESQRMIQTP